MSINLEAKSLVELVKCYENEKENQEKFELRDFILRRLASNPETVDNLPEELNRDVKRLDPKEGVFYTVDELGKGIIQDNRPKEDTNEPRSLQVSLEYDKAITGGVGVVVKSLTFQMKAKGIDGRVVTPFYDIYKKDIDPNNLKFVGFINHELNGEVLKSSIYKTMSQGGKVPQYLVQCDPSKKNIFNIGAGTEVYSATESGYTYEERSLYLASVIAVMGSTYRGRKKQKQFDIVSFQTVHAALAAHLMKDTFEPLREKAGLKKVYTLQHFHHGSLEESRASSSAKAYQSLGIKVPDNVQRVTWMEDIWLHTDGVGFVSALLPTESQKKETGYGLENVAQHISKYNRMGVLPNGIVWDDHGLTSQKAHGTFAASKDLVAAKDKVKSDLFKAGIIPDPKKPLFIYVGRYAEEKGIDKLEAMVKAAIDGGGQCVVMGWGVQKDVVPEDIQKLQRLSNEYQKNLKVYTQPEDQTAQFGASGATKGSLIRAAADAQFLPSRFESFALVGVEALARGVLLVSSDGGALKLLCNSQNGFQFTNEGDATANAVVATQKAVNHLNQQTSQDRKETVSRLVEDSKQYDWLCKDGALEKVQALYKQIMKPMTEIERVERDQLTKEYYDKVKDDSPCQLKSRVQRIKEALQFAWKKVCLFCFGIFKQIHLFFFTVWMRGKQQAHC